MELMEWHGMEYNFIDMMNSTQVQCSAVQYSAVQCNTVQYSTVNKHQNDMVFKTSL